VTRSSGSVLRAGGATLGFCGLLLARPAQAADPVADAASAAAPTQDAATKAEVPAPTPDAPTQVPDPILPSLVSTNAPPPLVWHWSRFSTADYLIGLAGGAITLGAAIVHPRSKHSLGGGLWFDSSVRSALRAHSLNNRYIFRDASDVGISLMVTWPIVADSLTTAWWYRGSRDVAEQMALIDLETFAIAGAIQGVTNDLVSRERPYGPDCGSAELPSDAIDCSGPTHYRSFFSGHSTLSFTGAALICVHHFENELVGAPWDALSCAGGYAVAATTATFRVVSDVHYATDVLTGALVGTLVGYGVPLLHYRHKTPTTQTASELQLHLIPSPGGLGILGIF
jgi:membrane-associated phospholipid phosphatase